MFRVLQATPSSTLERAPVNRCQEICLQRVWKESARKLANEVVMELEFEFDTDRTVPAFGRFVRSYLWFACLLVPTPFATVLQE